MPQLLLEFFSEEIPARMQPRAEHELVNLFEQQMKARGLDFTDWWSVKAFAGPRRLTLVVDDLPEETEPTREERKGPRTDAPEKALEGFMRGAGISSLDQCEKRSDKKGEFYVAVIEKPGVKTADVIASVVPEIVKNFPWPKSMKFGEGDKTQRWVRPLQRIVCLFGGEVVPVEVFGLTAGNVTEGHRMHGPGPFTVTDFADYKAQLEGEGYVLIDRDRREELILEGAKKVCADAGLELIEDAGLLTEVAGLAEHPIPLLGQMDPDFLDLPPEVIQLSMKTHQKYFAVRDPKTGDLAPNFVVVANQDAPDGGVAIAAGNARVLSARLSDARHFWDNDRKTPLSEMAAQLDKVTFHQKLGSVADKVERVAALARELAPAVGADPDMAERAARLAKADLVSEMVYEFPELQGAMGRYYALEQGEPAEIADAIRDHYKPQGPSDAVPTAPVSAAVALADKLDTLVGFWAIDEKPTGSKDPFALRRAALGVIRILLECGVRLDLGATIVSAFDMLVKSSWKNGSVYWQSDSFDHDFEGTTAKAVTILDLANANELRRDAAGKIVISQADGVWNGTYRTDAIADFIEAKIAEFLLPDEMLPTIISFFADRLKVHLKDDGISHDVIDAVFALGDDDLVRVTDRARALQGFLDTEDGKALLAGYKRAANILKAEEKTDGEGAFDGELDGGYAPVEAEEKALIAALEKARPAIQASVEAEDFDGAMRGLSSLRGPVDAFFDKVTVNDKDDMLRRNRLRLLASIRAAAHSVADFGRIEG
ncbi:glycine--tRNA ligase subunit beta [Hyphobacterium sp.]|uniref:glycine--tRNA ligase subunit beta n=1 Tax=Hyphobacterium sp. TaxID=2004662 RepID=UPI003748C14A